MIFLLEYMEKNSLTLKSSMDITASDWFAQTLEEAINKGGDIYMDAEEVSRLTTPCLQLLLAAKNSLESHQNKIIIERASPQFQEACEILGISNQFSIAE